MNEGENPQGHPTPEEFDLFLRRDLPEPELERLVAHLLSGCTACAEIVAEHLLPPPPVPVDRYDWPVAAAMAAARKEQRALEQARNEVTQRLFEILSGAQLDQELSVETTRCHRWAWCELLLGASILERKTNLEGAAELAEMAALLADELAADGFPPEALADLQARAWAELANSRRALGNLRDAETCLKEALRRQQAGSRNPLLLARILDIAGSLFRDQRRFAESLESLETATSLYLAASDDYLAGRALVIKTDSLRLDNRPEEALSAVAEALRLLDLDRDPGLGLAAIHNGLLALVDAGHGEAAARLLWSARALYEEIGTPLDMVRRLGVEAKIALATGYPKRAENLLRDEKAAFESAGHTYSAALVSLDLAALLLDQGHPGEVLFLVEEMLETFREHQILREAIASVVLLHRAVVRGEASSELVRRIAVEIAEIAARGTAR